jgi:flagellar hook protein FlgE
MFDDTLRPTTALGAIQYAELGIQRGLARAEEAARSVSTSTADQPADLARAAVEMLQAQAQVGANARVLRTADAMIGTLIDLRA